jgi:hypothetical protein
MTSVSDSHQSCIFCGYDLFGLEVSGNCPECGAAVEASIHGNLLEFSNPQWLERVKLGTVLLFWGITGCIGGVGFFILIVWICFILFRFARHLAQVLPKARTNAGLLMDSIEP